jgi:hypothetical protein
MIESLSGAEVKFTPIRRYPSSAFDLSVIAPLRAHAGSAAERGGIVCRPAAGIDSVRAGIRRSAATGGLEERVVPRHGGVAGAHVVVGRSGPDPRRMIDGMRGLGYELRV